MCTSGNELCSAACSSILLRAAVELVEAAGVCRAAVPCTKQPLLLTGFPTMMSTSTAAQHMAAHFTRLRRAGRLH